MFFSCVGLIALAVGYLTARETGRVKAAQWAGALAVGLPATLLAIVNSVRTVATHNNQLETTDSFKTAPTSYLLMARTPVILAHGKRDGDLAPMEGDCE